MSKPEDGLLMEKQKEGNQRIRGERDLEKEMEGTGFSCV